MRSMLKENKGLRLKWKVTPNYSHSLYKTRKSSIKAHEPSKWYLYLSEKVKN